MTRTSPCEVDRLTRSLADFAKIVDVLDAHNASFVSVTQQFNTTTSMGRLTLNMLLSFAQFEREIAGERIRDKIVASKKKGMWMGGNVPLGYDVKDRKLIVNEPEASTLRLIFRRYAELGSVALLKAALDRQDIVSKRREGAGGRLAGGQHFSRGALYLMLQNRLYRGDIVHQGEAYPGQHEAILDPELWQIVQDKLTANRRERSLAVGAEAPSLLAGLIVDSDGNRMTPTHAKKRAKRYRYYVSAPLLAGEGLRVSAGDIEALVLDRLRALLSSRTDVSETLAPLDLDAYALDGALRKVLKLSERWLAMPPVELKSLVQEIVDRITVAADRIEIQLSRAKIAAALQVGERGQRPDLDPVVLSIEAKVRRAVSTKTSGQIWRYASMKAWWPTIAPPRTGVRIRLDFCRKGRIAMCVGRWIWLPAGALRARPAICGALGRASVNSDAANQRSPNPCRPFPSRSPRTPRASHPRRGAPIRTRQLGARSRPPRPPPRNRCDLLNQRPSESPPPKHR